MFAGTLTIKCVARLVMIVLRERMYATTYVIRIYFSKFVRTYGTSIHHGALFLHNYCIVSPLNDLIVK